MQKYKTISVVGLGYIGLPTAAVFASRGIKVIGVDVSRHVVDTINSGAIHIIEPDLDMVVRAAVSQGMLRASLTPEPAEAFLIAVPTPFLEGENGDLHEPDLRYIRAASDSIAPVLKTGDLVILESTSPVGATEQMAEWLAERRPDLTFPRTHGENSDIRIAHCPERVLPGQVLRELVQNDRIIGGMTPRCSRDAIALYRTFVDGDCVVTDARTAELCKLTENSFRDVNIAFANELSLICERLGVNVWELIHLANKHPRVNILQPGPGVGGHCIAVDPWFIVSSAPETARLIHTAREVNDGKPRWVVKHVFDALEEIVGTGVREEDVVIACYGLTFKPDIDDLRESPALQIVTAVAERFQGTLKIVEPNVHVLPAVLSNAVHVDEEPVDAHLHVILVGHRSFRTMPAPAGRVLDFCGAVENRPKLPS